MKPSGRAFSKQSFTCVAPLVHDLPTKKHKDVKKFSDGSRAVTLHIKILLGKYLSFFLVSVTRKSLQHTEVNAINYTLDSQVSASATLLLLVIVN